jgi:urease accessory protein
MRATLLLLADGRFPAGGHAHSGGLEPAVTAGRVADVPGLAAFLRGRLATVGLVAAAFAAAAAAPGAAVPGLDEALDARTPSPAQRKASRAQGRALLRAGRALWPLPRDLPVAPHHPVAVGAVAAAAGLDTRDAALVAAHGAVAGPASAAVRLLGLDPYAVHGLLARLAPDCDEVADRAARLADGPVDDLPAACAPLLDLGAEAHARWEVRLFAS